MSNIDPKLEAIIDELKAKFPNLSDQELFQAALDYYKLELQKPVNNFIQPAPVKMSEWEYQIKLEELDFRIFELEAKAEAGIFLGKNASYFKRIEQSLEDLRKLREELRAKYYTTKTYDDSDFEPQQTDYDPNPPSLVGMFKQFLSAFK